MVKKIPFSFVDDGKILRTFSAILKCFYILPDIFNLTRPFGLVTILKGKTHGSMHCGRIK
jgi:hypothetical protein